MVKVRNSRRRDIVKIAEHIYEQQLDVDTPPAEMEDVTELLLRLAKEVKKLQVQIKRLKTEVGDDA